MASPSMKTSFETPLVSVIVPFYNSEDTLESCIEALLAQRDVGGFYEILLVDNRSTDRSAEIASRYQVQNSADGTRLTVLHESEAGAYAARNKGLRHASAPLIAFTDSDCDVDPRWLRAIRQGMEDPGVAILLGHCRYPGEASLPLRFLAAYENAKTQYVLEKKPSTYHFGYTNNMAVRASVFDQIGPFKLWKRAADTELIHRLAANISDLKQPEQRVAFQPAMKIIHREFLTARDRARRLSLYTSTNSKIETFRELGAGGRLGVLLRFLGA
ncbi:MAG: glycosyltransferase [Acidobacteriota bacterium]